jgi:hypothetical protein
MRRAANVLLVLVAVLLLADWATDVEWLAGLAFVAAFFSLLFALAAGIDVRRSR